MVEPDSDSEKESAIEATEGERELPEPPAEEAPEPESEPALEPPPEEPRPEEPRPEAPEPETPKPEPAAAPEVKPTPASPPDEEEIQFAAAPSTPLEKQNRLVVKNKYLGYGKNTEGVMGLCGQLKISHFDDSALNGRLESSNPLLFLSPRTLSGKHTTVTYWLPPVAFPHPAGNLSIKTADQNKTLSVHSLFPKSRTDLMSTRKVILCLLLPALIAFGYFAFVYVLTARGVDWEARQLFPELYSVALSGAQGADFRSHGLGLYRLKVVPAAETLQMIWAAVIFLAPVAASKFFYYLSRERRRRLAGVLVVAQLLPSVLLLLTWSLQAHVLPLYFHRDFAPLDLRGFVAWGVPMNIAIAAYLFFSVFGVWDRKVKPPELRVALPVVLTFVYLAVMFVTIYGRSWIT